MFLRSQTICPAARVSQKSSPSQLTWLLLQSSIFHELISTQLHPHRLYRLPRFHRHTWERVGRETDREREDRQTEREREREREFITLTNKCRKRHNSILSYRNVLWQISCSVTKLKQRAMRPEVTSDANVNNDSTSASRDERTHLFFKG